MKSVRHADGERILAVFIDFENIGIGLNNRRDRFDITRILERLVEKGKIVAKKAYADWSRFSQYTTSLHEAAIELVEIPRRSQSGKNSADIRLCVDAMDLAYSKDHIDTFVIVSGDSDFSPLVSKLKELGKHVIGLGLAEATSELLRDNCDEFIYYDDLGGASTALPPIPQNLPESQRKVFGLLMESLLALRRENKEVLWSSMIKDTMKRKKPSFNEEYHGYRTFSELLEDARQQGLLELEKHKTSGTYVVTRFGSELRTRTAIVKPLPDAVKTARPIVALPPAAAPVITVPPPVRAAIAPPRAPSPAARPTVASGGPSAPVSPPPATTPAVTPSPRPTRTAAPPVVPTAPAPTTSVPARPTATKPVRPASSPSTTAPTPKPPAPRPAVPAPKPAEPRRGSQPAKPTRTPPPQMPPDLPPVDDLVDFVEDRHGGNEPDDDADSRFGAGLD